MILVDFNRFATKKFTKRPRTVIRDAHVLSFMYEFFDWPEFDLPRSANLSEFFLLARPYNNQRWTSPRLNLKLEFRQRERFVRALFKFY